MLPPVNYITADTFKGAGVFKHGLLV